MANDIHKIEFDSILIDLKTSSVKHALKTLSAHVHRLIGAPEDKIFKQFMAFEKEGTSAIGNGVSIPHMRLPRLTRPMTIFAKLPTSIDFSASDGEPVDMICLILSPEFEGPKHLQRLHTVTRFFNNKEIREALRGATDKDDVRMILKQENHLRLAA